MTNRDTVIQFMNSIKDKTPILLIARAAKIFHNIYTGRIYDVHSEEDMDIINNMSISKLTKPVVISDLSSLYDDEDMLKLIEESKLQFILLAYKDNLSDVLVSRCKSILKIPDIDINECKYTSKKSALSSLEKINNPYEVNLFLAENCPSLMRDMIDTQYIKYKERVVNILANMEGGINDR